MRKLGAAVLAIPVLVTLYVTSLVHRDGHGRIVGGIAAGAVIALVLVASLPPAPSTAVPASAPREVSAELLDTVHTGHSVVRPFEVGFDAQMDAASVAGALRVAPEAAVSISWDRAGRTLTIAPVGHWQPDTLYTVTVDTSARSQAGGRLTRAVHAVVLTAPAGTGSIEPTRTGSRGHARPDTSFRIRLSIALPREAVATALRSDPFVTGTLAAGTVPGEYLFTPAAPLDPDTSYRVWLEGLADGDGIPFASAPAVELVTVAAPEVVRFRPRTGTKAVDRAAALSVRFTERMARATTGKAFSATANGKAVSGKVSWAEHGTVLVFRPSHALAYGAKIAMTVDATATSRAGAPIAGAKSGSFTVESKPKPRPRHRSTAIQRSGGGGAASGSWHSVEVYYLHLMNCTRTGGWVTSKGTCSSPGGRNVAPLALSSGISSRVSRPYAKLLATRGLCDHFIGGTPGDRLRRAGYTSYRWAENLGCRSGNPYSAVLGSHLYFQSEKPYNGGHYRNLMNSDYDRAGIGVWVSGGRVRLVVDFYHP